MKGVEQTKDLKFLSTTHSGIAKDFAHDHLTIPPHSDQNDQAPTLNAEELNNAMTLLNDLLIASYAAQKSDAKKLSLSAEPFYGVAEPQADYMHLPDDISSLMQCADKAVRKVF